MSTEAIKKNIRGVLIADSAVRAMVVSGSMQRIYPRKLPTALTLPAISYSLPSNVLNPLTRIRVVRFRFVCWGESSDDADDLASAVEEALQGYSSTTGTEISNTNPEQIIEQPEDAAGLYSAIVDVTVVVKGE